MQWEWRDSKEWAKLGLPMSSPSNEACKMFDASLGQVVQMYEDDSIGGLPGTIDKMMVADPNCVMGHVLVAGLDLIGTGNNPLNNTELRQRLAVLATLAKGPNVNGREKLHAEAIRRLADGYLEEASALWEQILLKYPRDMVAIKFANVAYIYLGMANQMKDSVARVLPHWKPETPHYSYLFGLYGFALNEANLQVEAEKQTRKGLELNPRDGWATHALAHVMEHQGRQDEAISFLGSTVKDWSPVKHVACHNYWHWGVFHIEKGDYEAVLNIYDTEVGRRATIDSVFFNLMDAASMLFRLELEGVNVGDRWETLYCKALAHTDDHNLAFGDAHVVMACLGSKQKQTVQKMMEGVEEFIKEGRDTYKDVTREVGQALCQSLAAYKEGDYSEAANLLYPKRYLVHRIGGSVAQRDVFSLLLIQACIRSPLPEHHRMARQLLHERKAFKENAPMTDRLMAKAMAAHVD